MLYGGALNGQNGPINVDDPSVSVEADWSPIRRHWEGSVAIC